MTYCPINPAAPVTNTRGIMVHRHGYGETTWRKGSFRRTHLPLNQLPAVYRHKYCAIEAHRGEWKGIVRCQTVGWKIL